MLCTNRLSAIDPQQISKPSLAPGGFLKNAGQVIDMDGRLCPDVMYSVQLDNLALFITKNGITYAMIQKQTNPFAPAQKSKSKFFQPDDDGMCRVVRLDMLLPGSTILPERCVEETTDQSRGVVNYYGGGLTEQARNLSYVKKLRIKEVYPGIDWILKLGSDGFKYDFELKPGADEGLISIKYSGADKLELDPDLLGYRIFTPLETITEGGLLCYAGNGQTVKANYFLKGPFELGIALHAYEKTNSLLIDPTVSLPRTWATYFGGGDDDYIYANKIDAANSYLYFAGQSHSINFPPLYNNGTSYYKANSSTTGMDAFICRTDLSGEIDWCTYVLSSANEGAMDVTVDGDGTVYLVGYTHSSTGNSITFPIEDAGGYLQGLNSSGTTADAFIVKFNSSGVMQWSTVFGNTTPSNQSEDVIYGVACNAYNAVYVVGRTESNGTSNFPLLQQGSGYYVTGNNAPDGFIAAFDHYTDLIWSTFTENSANFSVAIDHDDNIFTVGYSEANYFSPYPTTGNAFFQNYQAYADGTIMAFDLSSNKLWQTYVGANENEMIVDCDISEYDQNLYVGGFIENSTTSNTISFPFKNPGSGYYDTYWNTTVTGTNKHGFFGQFDTDFDDVWITLFAGDGTDEVVAVNINEGGNLFVTGNNTWLSGGTDFPLYDAGSPFYWDNDAEANNYAEPYLAMLGPERDIEWCTYYGEGETSEISTDIDVNERILLWTGISYNNNAFSTVSTLQENSNSWIQTVNSSLNKADGMIAKFANSASYNLKQAVSFIHPGEDLPDFMILTNPVIDNILLLKQITASEDAGFFISVSDLLGRNIISPMFVENASRLQITLPVAMNEGMYQIRITGSKGSQSLKFIRISNF